MGFAEDRMKPMRVREVNARLILPFAKPLSIR
jgi:hypothetical protein